MMTRVISGILAFLSWLPAGALWADGAKPDPKMSFIERQEAALDVMRNGGFTSTDYQFAWDGKRFNSRQVKNGDAMSSKEFYVRSTSPAKSFSTKTFYSGRDTAKNPSEKENSARHQKYEATTSRYQSSKFATREVRTAEVVSRPAKENLQSMKTKDYETPEKVIRGASQSRIDDQTGRATPVDAKKLKDMPRTPLTIDEIREILNKNK